jgi:NADPH:quinone reductase-like Zn-dependent oxidoreductase
MGDRVWGLMPHLKFGSITEFVVAPASRVALAPNNQDLIDAAALPAVGTTVIRAFRTEAALRAGERLLVRGASGGVGSVAVQFGKALGAHVTGLAGSLSLEWVRSLGADEVHDYVGLRPARLGRFDVVLDLVGTEMETYRRLLAPGGRMIGLAFDPNKFIRTILYVAGTVVFGGRRVRAFSNDPDNNAIAGLTALVEANAIRPLVDKKLPLDQIAEAHRALEKGGVRGKIVIKMP